MKSAKKDGDVCAGAWRADEDLVDSHVSGLSGLVEPDDDVLNGYGGYQMAPCYLFPGPSDIPRIRNCHNIRLFS